MTKVETTVTETTVAAPAAPAVPVVKAPSKKSLAQAIFDAGMAKRTAGGFDSNKAFRTEVIQTISKNLDVTIASASTMYNQAKKDAEAADATVGLGRDPKKVVVKVEGAKRGRPAKAKVDAVATPADAEVAPVVAATEPTVIVITEPVAEVAAEVASEPAAA